MEARRPRGRPLPADILPTKQRFAGGASERLMETSATEWRTRGQSLLVTRPVGRDPIRTP